MPEERKWQEWLERLHNLRRDKRGSHERPHKPVLLPSLLDLLDRGQVKNNGSLKESMDEFRFRELAEHMEKRDFASFVRAETV
ncbi:MAG: hypothetical protein ACLQVX_25785 [Limisphaerales bacterium]